MLKNAIAPSKEAEAEIQIAIKRLYEETKPRKYSNGEGSVLVEHMRNFEEQCGMIEKHFHINAEALPLFKFLSRMNSIKKEAESQRNATRGHKFEQLPESLRREQRDSATNDGTS